MLNSVAWQVGPREARVLSVTARGHGHQDRSAQREGLTVLILPGG